MSDLDQPEPHPRRVRAMDFRAAVAASLLLGAVSFLLLWAADEATDLSAVAGGIGLVIAGSLLGLTVLARRWERERVGYVNTAVEEHAALGAFDLDSPGRAAGAPPAGTPAAGTGRADAI